MHHTGIRPDGLRKIADNLDLVADEYDRAGHPKHESVLRNNSAVLRRMANRIVQLETQMGRVADDIAKLTADRDAQKHRADTAEGQLTAAQANALDAADLAALDKVEADLSAAGGTGSASVTPATPTPPTP